MKFTIVIDMPDKDLSHGPYTSKEQVEMQAKNVFENVEYVAVGDKTNREWFGVVRWCEDDIEEALYQRGYKVCGKNVEAVMAEVSGGLEDVMVSAGWDAIDVYVGMASDLLLEDEEECNMCGEHFVPEDDKVKDVCPDCIEKCKYGVDPVR